MIYNLFSETDMLPWRCRFYSCEESLILIHFIDFPLEIVIKQKTTRERKRKKRIWKLSNYVSDGDFLR